MSSHKRKRILIDPTTQLALAGSFALNWCCFLGLMILLAMCMEIIVQYPDQTFVSIAQGVYYRHAQTLILMLLICPYFIYRSVKFSHRFAGPIWRLRRELRRLREGDRVTAIRFRKNDFWQDLADDVNWVLERLQHAEQRQQTEPSEDEAAPPAVRYDFARR